MGRETKIPWCHHTFNGVRGCEHATLADGTSSPGCDHCYAETMSKRNPGVLGSWGDEGTRILGTETYWANLDKWHREAVAAGQLRRVFCYSLGDVFENPRRLWNADVCTKGRALLFEAIERLRSTLSIERPPGPTGMTGAWKGATNVKLELRGYAGLIFMLLTKRPENVRRLVPASWLRQWPQHVWLGTSVENQQAADERIPHLLDVPGVPVRFLSIEPLLERVNIKRWMRRYSDGSPMCGYCCNKYPQDGPCECFYRPECPRCQGTGRAKGIVGWAIAGGESGHARPCDLAWLRDLRDQCKAAGVPFFNKQAGAYATDGMYAPRPKRPDIQVPRVLQLKHPKGEDPEEWPEDLRVREVPHV